MISTVLSAVLLNCGTYGILRIFAIAHQTQSWDSVSIILLVFGVITILIAALSLIPRTNIKKLIAFSSIEHMGLVLIGTGLGTPVAIFWTLFHILGHSLIKSLLFFSAGILNRQYNSNRMPDMKNIFRLQPLAGWGMIIGSAAVIGLPPFPIFLSKLFLLTQIGSYSLPLLTVVLVLFLIVAGAFAYLLIKMFSQQTETKLVPYSSPWSMKIPIIILFAAIIAIGVYLSFGFSDLLNTITASLGF